MILKGNCSLVRQNIIIWKFFLVNMFHLESKKLENFGLEISDDGWTTNKFKVTNILNVKPPLFTTEVRRFITKKIIYNIINYLLINFKMHQISGKKKLALND